MGGVGALLAAPLEQASPPDPGQREAQQPVGAVAFGEPVPEVGQDAVVEAGVFQFQSEGVLEVDAAANRLGGLAVRQVHHVLQHTDGGQLCGREPGAAVARVPGGEVLIVPQAVEAVADPHRRGAIAVAGSGDPHGQRRDLGSGPRLEGHIGLLRNMGGTFQRA